MATAQGHHDAHNGPVILFNPSLGINNPDTLQLVTPGTASVEGELGRRIDQNANYHSTLVDKSEWNTGQKLIRVPYQLPSPWVPAVSETVVRQSNGHYQRSGKMNYAKAYFVLFRLSGAEPAY